MKTKFFYVFLILLLILTISLPNTLAQGYPQWHLPEGAKARLGKSDINSLAYSPNGSRLAVATELGVWLYNARTGDEVALLKGDWRWNSVTSVSFSPDGQTLAGGSGMTVILWEAETGERIRTLEGHSSWVMSVSFSPDGQTLASGSWDETVILWNANTGERIRRLNRHTDGVFGLSFSPDGQTLASGGYQDKTVILWDVSTGRHVHTLRYTGNVNSVSFSPDGQTLASASGTEIYLWSMTTRRALQTLEGHTATIQSISFSPDGQTLASAGGFDNTVRLWSVSTGINFKTLEGHTDFVESVSFSPNGTMLASGSWDGTVILQDAVTGSRVRTLTGHIAHVESVVFSPDGQTLACGNGDGTVRLWSVSTGVNFKTLEGHVREVTSVSFSPNGMMLASGSMDGRVILWDIAAGERIRTLEGHPRHVESISFSPDGQTLVSGGWDGRVIFWNPATGERIRTLEGIHSVVESVSFSPDGAMFASGGFDNRVILWDTATGARIHTLEGHGNEVSSVSFSPNGQTLASGSWDETVILWNANTGERIRTLEGHTWRVYSVMFSPDGAMLASGGGDGTLILWNANTGERIRTIDDTQGVRGMSFSPGGAILASGGFDGMVLLWQLPATISITPSQVESPAIGEQFSINVRITAGESIGGYQLTLGFDPSALRYVSSANGNYLTEGSYFVQPVVSDNNITLGATNFANVSSGEGVLATITFEVVDVKESTLNLSNIILADSVGNVFLSPNIRDGEVVQPPPVASSAIVRVTPSQVLSPARHQQFTLNADIVGGQNIAAHRLFWGFDDEPLELLSGKPGDYLADGIGNGDGTLFTGTFKVRAVKASTVSVSGHLIGTDGLRYIPIFESSTVVEPIFGDVNRDGVVDIRDLVLVASSFNQPVSEEGNPADVTENDIVNIVDLVKVAAVIGGGAAAPAVLNQDMDVALTRGDVQQWLSQAQQLNLTDATSQRGILFLQQLLTALTPKETALLPNYPNPFNPETWIPYQLAKPVDVTVTIYTVDGTVVRTLALGYQPVGIYQGKSRAAYWDGRNAQGEPVASGVYFYTLKAGNFTATRKMLIRK